MVLLIANKKLPSQEVILISVGIDVVKGKSTVCILKPYEKIVSKPFDISHVEKDLGELAAMLLRYAILVREEFSCLINSHGQGHEQLDSIQ